MRRRLFIFPLIVIVAAVVLWTSVAVYAALTKTTAAGDEWAPVAANTIREGTTITLNASYASVLHISCALTTTAVAQTGPKIIIQGSGNSTGDEDWFEITSFSGPVGTPLVVALAGTEAIGSTVLEVAATTGLFDDDGVRNILILDDTVADSELCTLVSHVAATSVTIQDPTTNAHTVADSICDMVSTWTISIPFGVYRVRVIYDNTYDADAGIHTYCRVSTVTGI